jgi:serine/threonine protein kinase
VLLIRRQDCSKIPQIRDLCAGLTYLHSIPVVHGDLKGVRNFFIVCSRSLTLFRNLFTQNNVLIDDDGRAVLTDFGLSKVIDEISDPTGNTTVMMGGAIRWKAPELLFDEPEDSTSPEVSPMPSTASDVYSFACTAYEVSPVRRFYRKGWVYTNLPLSTPYSLLLVGFHIRITSMIGVLYKR